MIDPDPDTILGVPSPKSQVKVVALNGLPGGAIDVLTNLYASDSHGGNFVALKFRSALSALTLMFK